MAPTPSAARDDSATSACTFDQYASNVSHGICLYRHYFLIGNRPAQDLRAPAVTLSSHITSEASIDLVDQVNLVRNDSFGGLEGGGGFPTVVKLCVFMLHKWSMLQRKLNHFQFFQKRKDTHLRRDRLYLSGEQSASLPATGNLIDRIKICHDNTILRLYLECCMLSESM